MSYKRFYITFKQLWEGSCAVSIKCINLLF